MNYAQKTAAAEAAAKASRIAAIRQQAATARKVAERADAAANAATADWPYAEARSIQTQGGGGMDIPAGFFNPDREVGGSDGHYDRPDIVWPPVDLT